MWNLHIKMKITFKINETINEVFASVKEMGRFVTGRYELFGDLKEVAWIEDEDFPQSTAEIFIFKDEDDEIYKIEIITAWSGFKYTLYNWGDDKKVEGTYEGAFKGFMEQNLLPEFTVDMDSIEDVFSSQLGWSTLNDYLIHRRKLNRFYEDNLLPFGGCPRIFWGINQVTPETVVKKMRKA